jgi:hypothetical protein
MPRMLLLRQAPRRLYHHRWPQTQPLLLPSAKTAAAAAAVARRGIYCRRSNMWAPCATQGEEEEEEEAAARTPQSRGCRCSRELVLEAGSDSQLS